MSRAEGINYPPPAVQEPLYPNKKNFEHIILWMLKNNDVVQWSHFAEEPIKISQGSLSKYTTKLLNQGYIFRIKRGLSATILDSVMVAFALNLAKIPDNIKSRYKQLLDDNPDNLYMKYIYESTTDEKVVKQRILFAIENLFK